MKFFRACSRQRIFAGLILLLALSAPSGAQVSNPLSGGGGGGTPPTSTPAPDRLPGTAVEVPDNYLLDTGDVITIEVLRHTEVNRTQRIPADGKVRLPRLLSPVTVREKTCADLITEITGKLVTEGKLVLRPGQVNIYVTEMRMRRIYVQGNIGKTGDYQLQNGWRISELVSVIGSPPQPERVRAKLVNPRRTEPITLNLNAILSNPESPENILLQEGDTLYLEMPRNKRLLVKGEANRGIHELDERFGLRQALIQLGFSATGATGDLRHSFLYRHETPGDPTSPVKKIPVDLYALLTDDSAPDILIQDMDTLDVPVSMRFIYIYGEISAPRKQMLPEDRKTYLVDIMALGPTTGKAKIDDIKIWRMENGKPTVKSYKFGKFLANGDLKQNPEILPQDVVFVPDVKRPDPMGTIWTAWGLYGILSTLIPGVRPPN
jgi:protein involved in polysaccharide export with SLBB domain